MQVPFPLGAGSCDDSLIDTSAPPPLRIDFRDEHIGSRKAWCAYVNLTTVVHRQTAAEADNFVAQMRGRLEQAMRPHR